MNVLLLVLDGLADRPAAELDGRTPLEAARTPNLDAIVSSGAAGLVDPLGPGVCPGTDTSHFVFFGNPLSDYPGRGLIEATGAGLSVTAGDVVLKGSFIHVERRGDTLHVVRRGIDIDGDSGAAELVLAIGRYEMGGYHLDLVHTGGKESIVYVRGGGCSPHVTDSDPYADDRSVCAVMASGDADEPEEAAATADAITEYLRWAHLRLEEHPINQERAASGLATANFLSTKWAARRGALTRFSERFPFTGASVSTGPLFRGICAELGLSFRNVPYLDDAGEDVARRVETGLELLGAGYDFVHVHTKLIDQAAHKKDPELKRQVIEACDAGLSRLAAEPASETLLIVTADHATASTGGELVIHSGEPVPIAVRGRTIAVDGVREFSELACAGGLLGRTRGSDLMPQVLNWTDRAGYYGARMMPASTLARPLAPIPFTLE